MGHIEGIYNNSTFKELLFKNIDKYYPNIRTNDGSLIYYLKKNNIKKFKSIELIIPSRPYFVHEYEIEDFKNIPGFKFVMGENPFTLYDFFEITKNIKFNKNLYLKLNIGDDDANNKNIEKEEDIIDFNEINKLELIIEYKNIDDNIQLFKRFPILKQLYEKIKDLSSNNKKDDKLHFEFLDLLEKSPFEYLSLTNSKENAKYSINKKENSIEISLEFDHFNRDFLKKLSYYEKVKINVL